MKQVIRLIIAAIGVLLLIYSAVMLFTVNFNVGIVFTAALGVVFIAVDVFLDSVIKIKWLTALFAVMGIFAVTMVTFIALYGRNDNVDFNEDAVVVLGAGIAGEEATPQLKYRLDAAVRYLNDNRNAIIVVCGGQGPQESISEALAMERYLISCGIDGGRILKEDKSTSTEANIANAKDILDSLFDGEYNIALITSDYHIYRAACMARDAGFNCKHYHATIEWYAVPMRYVRECVAVLKYWIFG